MLLIKVSLPPCSRWSWDVSGSVRSVDCSWGVSISLPRDWHVTVAGSEDAGIGIAGVFVVEDAPSGEEIGEFGHRSGPQPQFAVVSSHIFCAFQSSHIRLPKLGLVGDRLVQADHVKVVSERHFHSLQGYFSSKLGLSFLRWGFRSESSGDGD